MLLVILLDIVVFKKFIIGVVAEAETYLIIVFNKLTIWGKYKYCSIKLPKMAYPCLSLVETETDNPHN